MNLNLNLQKNLLPVTCPRCGESQNIIDEGLNTDGIPVGTVSCMVCQHIFQQDEYLQALETRRQEFSLLTGPKVK